MAKRVSIIAGVLFALTGAATLTPSFAGDLPASAAAAAPSSLTGIAATVSGLTRLKDYFGGVAAEATDVSKREISVGKQYRCLAQAVYFEARGETVDGQRAVAHVVLNRLKDRRYPNTVCGVVFQNEHMKNRCQFSFACDGASDRPHNVAAWRQSLEVALEALAGVGDDLTNASTHYHARYVEPSWAMALTETTRVGQHIFYREERSSALLSARSAN